MKLKESIEKEIDPTVHIDNLYGAWEDMKSTDEIQHQIKFTIPAKHP